MHKSEKEKIQVIDTETWWYDFDAHVVTVSCFMNKKPVKGVFSKDRLPDIYMSLGYVKIGKLKLSLKKAGQRKAFDLMMESGWETKIKPAENMTIDYMSEKG